MASTTRSEAIVCPVRMRRPQRTSSITQALYAASITMERAASRLLSSALAEVAIRPVQSDAEMDEVYRITHDTYLQRGYCTPQPGGKLIHYPHLDRIPETTVLVALVEGRIVGTNSLTFDGPHGLPAEKDFGAAIAAIRAEGRTLASSWRLATRPECRCTRRVVMALLDETTRRGLSMGVQTCLISVIQYQERVYQRLMNMKTVAYGTETAGLQNATPVFMRFDTERRPKRFL